MRKILTPKFYFTLLLLFCLSIFGHEAIAQSDNSDIKQSLYQLIYNQEGLPQIVIDSDIKQLIRKSDKEEYQTAEFWLTNQKEQELLHLMGRTRARGNMRKQVCYIPPIKFDFVKGELDSLGLQKNDKLKLVFPCRDKGPDQERLYKEYLVYELYSLIDTNSVRARLIDFTLKNGEDIFHEFTGMIVEDEVEYAFRKKAKVIEAGKLKAQSLERNSFLKMTFFQYMIANTDFSITHKHNLEMVKLPDLPRVVALPYDFDYSGFVGQPYAVPHESLGLDDVHQRHFFTYDVNEEEFKSMVKYYSSIKDDIYATIDAASYLSDKSRDQCKFYLKSFFELLEKPKRLMPEIVK